MSEIIITKLEQYPELIGVKDLVELGLFTSNCSAYLARTRGQSPNYIKIGRKILFNKASVVEFIQRHLQDGSVSKASKEDNAGCNHAATSSLSK